jgi:hypothetical protein
VDICSEDTYGDKLLIGQLAVQLENTSIFGQKREYSTGCIQYNRRQVYGSDISGLGFLWMGYLLLLKVSRSV